MDMGEHCTLQSCLVLTFLPVNCPYCRHRFCQSHFLPLQHACKAPGAAEADRTLSDTEILKRIQRVNGRRKEVQAAGVGDTSALSQGGASPSSAAQAQGEEEPSRLPCQRSGCKRFSLHMDASRSAALQTVGNQAPLSVSKRDGRHDNTTTFTHAAPRCDRCRGFFCMAHRSPIAHGCSAPAPPTEGDKKRDAANERKRRAQEVLNKHFPNRTNK